MTDLPPLPPGATLDNLPPLPPGATLDNLPPLPPGAKLDQPTPSNIPDGYQPTQFGFNVKPAIAFNGKPTQQRDVDGGQWFGTEQGNTGMPGWFDKNGNRLGNTPGSEPPMTLAEKGKKLASDFGNTAMVLGEGLAKPGMALTQIMNKGLGATGYYSPQEMAQINHDEQVRQQMMAQDQAKVWGGGAVSGLGQLASIAPAALAVPALLEGAGAALGGMVVHGAAQAGSVGMLSSLLSPEAETGQGLGQLLNQKMGNAVNAGRSGATVGAALPVATSALSAASPYIVNAIKAIPGVPAAIESISGAISQMAKRMLGGATTPEMVEEAKTIANAAEKGGSSAGELTPSAMTKAIVPPSPDVVGAHEAVGQFADKLGQDMVQEPYYRQNAVQNLANSGGKRASKAISVLQDMATAGSDPARVAQADLRSQQLLEANRMDLLADARTQALAPIKSIPMDEPIAVIDKRIGQLGLDQSKNNAAEINALNDMKERLRGVPAGNVPYTMGTVGLTPAQATATRSGINEQLSDAYSKNGVIGAPSASFLKPLKDSIGKAISDAAQTSGLPDAIAADNAFNSEYSNYARTYQNPTVMEAMNTDKPHDFFSRPMLRKQDVAGTIADAMSPKGKAAVTKLRFDDIASAEANKRAGNFIPGNVSGGISDNQNMFDKFATTDQAQTLANIRRVNEALSSGNPANASALGDRMTSSIAQAAPGPLGAISRGIGGFKDQLIDKMFSSPEGRQWLLGTASKEGVPIPEPSKVNPVGKYQDLLGAIAGQLGAHKPNNQNEFDAIPSGHPYISQDGTAGIKP